MLLNVTEYRKRSAGGMLCCHSVEPDRAAGNTERGSKISEARFQPLPSLRLKRNRHDELRGDTDDIAVGGSVPMPSRSRPRECTP